LQWNLFRLPQLQQYEAMLLKLYKQDVINVVIKYERMRRAMSAELLRRTTPSSVSRVHIPFDDGLPDAETETIHL
jgi:hypothetical protein